jgi:hypothetical protein
MTATSRKMQEQEPDEMQLLLPWHAAGTLNASDARRVDEALARDAGLARQYAVIREEHAETIRLNEKLGTPSIRAIQGLFAAIEAEPPGRPSSAGLPARVIGFFARRSPRTLAWSAALGALALLLQAGVLGAVLLNSQSDSLQAASLNKDEMLTRAMLTRALGPEAPPRALVRFAPNARIADITALLDTYQASIIEGTKGGIFRLQFGNTPMTKDEVSGLMGKLQHDRIVRLAVPAP